MFIVVASLDQDDFMFGLFFDVTVVGVLVKDQGLVDVLAAEDVLTLHVPVALDGIPLPLFDNLPSVINIQYVSARVKVFFYPTVQAVVVVLGEGVLALILHLDEAVAVVVDELAVRQDVGGLDVDQVAGGVVAGGVGGGVAAYDG